MAHEARWYQQEAVDAVFDCFRDNPGYDAVGFPIAVNPLVCLPTGTGKSVVQTGIVRRAMNEYPGTRVFGATHVKELIEQNANKLLEAWPSAPLGIYSAGLKERQTVQPIVFGGVQSAKGKFPLFGKRDLLLIDEAHLCSPSTDTSYQKFIKELQWGEADPEKLKANPEAFKAFVAAARNCNPYLKVIGLTATAYRLGLGCLTNGGIFTHIAYDLCTIEGFNRLIAEGYLCPLIPKRTRTELDVSNVGMRNGEFVQGELQEAVDKSEVTYKALCEVVNEGYNRQSWLVFATGIEHAEHIGEMLNTVFGIPTCVIHSKKPDAENAESLARWKAGKYRAAVNMNSLTTGVDHPTIDLIAMLRPTMSTGLWVQMLGRGTRPYPGKENCLVLDFAGNTRRLGPINDPVIPKRKGEKGGGDAPVKICKECGTYNHTSAKVCVVCGTEFPSEEKIKGYADNAELIRSDLPVVEYFDVSHAVLTPHTSKQSGRHSIKVSYFCSGAIPRTFYEYVNVESTSSFVKHKARDWFRQRFTGYDKGIGQFDPDWDGDTPKTNALFIQYSQLGLLRTPAKIRVWVNKQLPEILGYDF